MLLQLGLDLYGTFTDGLEWVVRVFLEGLINALGLVFSVGIESYLFFENPINYPSLDAVWQTSFLIFVAIIGLGLLQHMFVLEIHPYNEDTNFQRLLERTTIAAIAVFLSKPFIALVVSFVHALTGAFYNIPFSLSWGVDILQRIMDATDIYVSIPLGIFVTAFLVVFGLGMLLLFVVRMFAVYMIYALFPFLMAMWIYDVGPVNQVREFTNKGFQMTAYLLLYGPIATAFLWVGAILGGFAEGSASGGTFASATVSVDTAGQFSSHGGELMAALGDLFMFLATIGAVLIFGLFGFLKLLK